MKLQTMEILKRAHFLIKKLKMETNLNDYQREYLLSALISCDGNPNEAVGELERKFQGMPVIVEKKDVLGDYKADEIFKACRINPLDFHSEEIIKSYISNNGNMTKVILNMSKLIPDIS